MPTRRLWITAEPWPATDSTLIQAEAAGATEILHGIPAALANLVVPGTTGYVEVAVPDPDPTPDPLTVLLSAIAGAQTLDEVRQTLAANGLG